MPIFVALGKATCDGVKEVGGLLQRHEAAVRRAEQLGGKVLSSYALLGPYDYLTVLECPDEKVAFRILAGEASHGHVHYETMVAVPFEEFARLMA